MSDFQNISDKQSDGFQNISTPKPPDDKYMYGIEENTLDASKALRNFPQPKMFNGSCTSGAPITLSVNFNISCVSCITYSEYPSSYYYSNGMGRLNPDGTIYQECVYSVLNSGGTTTVWTKNTACLGVTTGGLVINSIKGGTLVMTGTFGVGNMSYSIIIY